MYLEASDARKVLDELYNIENGLASNPNDTLINILGFSKNKVSIKNPKHLNDLFGNEFIETGVEYNDFKAKMLNYMTEELFNQIFELSFNEIRSGLNALCAIYRNENEWCYVEDVYEDYFVMYDWDSNNIWKQNYTKDGDTLALSGERVQLFAMLLTESEKISVENMRQNYEAICGQLAQYQKKELVNSNDYSAIADKEDFVAVVNDVNNGKNEMTFEELKENLDKMLLNYAKSGNLNFEAVEDKAKEIEDKKPSKKFTKVGLVPAGAKGNPKKSRYGNLFKR